MSKIKSAADIAGTVANGAGIPGKDLISQLNQIINNVNHTVNNVKGLIELARSAQGLNRQPPKIEEQPPPRAEQPPAGYLPPRIESPPAPGNNEVITKIMEQYGHLTLGQVLKEFDGVSIKTIYEVIKRVGLK